MTESVTIRLLGLNKSGEAVVVQFPQMLSIDDLKNEIYDKKSCKIPPDEQTMLFQGEQLSDDTTIHELLNRSQGDSHNFGVVTLQVRQNISQKINQIMSNPSAKIDTKEENADSDDDSNVKHGTKRHPRHRNKQPTLLFEDLKEHSDITQRRDSQVSSDSNASYHSTHSQNSNPPANGVHPSAEGDDSVVHHVTTAAADSTSNTESYDYDNDASQVAFYRRQSGHIKSTSHSMHEKSESNASDSILDRIDTGVQIYRDDSMRDLNNHYELQEAQHTAHRDSLSLSQEYEETEVDTVIAERIDDTQEYLHNNLESVLTNKSQDSKAENGVPSLRTTTKQQSSPNPTETSHENPNGNENLTIKTQTQTQEQNKQRTEREHKDKPKRVTAHEADIGTRDETAQEEEVSDEEDEDESAATVVEHPSRSSSMPPEENREMEMEVKDEEIARTGSTVSSSLGDSIGSSPAFMKKPSILTALDASPLDRTVIPNIQPTIPARSSSSKDSSLDSFPYRSRDSTEFDRKEEEQKQSRRTETYAENMARFRMRGTRQSLSEDTNELPRINTYARQESGNTSINATVHHNSQSKEDMIYLTKKRPSLDREEIDARQSPFSTLPKMTGHMTPSQQSYPSASAGRDGSSSSLISKKVLYAGLGFLVVVIIGAIVLYPKLKKTRRGSGSAPLRAGGGGATGGSSVSDLQFKRPRRRRPGM